MAYSRDYSFYTISEVARYFGRSTDWMRIREAEGRFRDRKDKPIVFLRTVSPSDKSPGERRYTMPDIWNMALSCEKQGIITKEHRDAILDVLRAIKRVQKMRGKNGRVKSDSKSTNFRSLRFRTSQADRTSSEIPE